MYKTKKDIKYFNRLIFKGKKEEINQVIKDVCKPHFTLGSMDFNTITPMPKWVHSKLNVTQEELKSPSPSLQKILQERSDWTKENWGVEENAIPTAYNDATDTIRFTTKKEPAMRLMRKLAMMYPDVTIHYQFAGSDIGNITGDFTFKHYDVLDGKILPVKSKEAVELAYDLWYGGLPDFLIWDEEEERYTIKT